jgi:ribosome biogenesis GTPase / thiamine phosphate phosphatase
MGKGHKRGYQWREDPRALAKKERAKQRHFGVSEKNKEIDAKEEFIIGKEQVKDQFGVVANMSGGSFSVLFRSEYIDCTLNKEVPVALGRMIVVGDYVTLQQTTQGSSIDHLVERTTSFSRLRRDNTRWGSISSRDEHVIAANVDTAIIVAAAKNPPFHPKFVDRYLVLVQHGGIRPIICLNKCDLPQEGTEILEYYKQLGIGVVRTSAEAGTGIEELKDTIRGQSSVLVGHSGVGKSSLINKIYPQADLRVGSVGEKSGKGRHTTTTSQLLVWDDHSYIIDTPGIRSLGMWNIDPQDLQLYFDDISKFAEECRFSDCLHDNTPAEVCGVVRAVEQGLLPVQRYESYIKILRGL